jgi:demethylmenaquinone methyltransferase/2-methoxy-6-polyprenyl-1,4-benzoquinol methylase
LSVWYEVEDALDRIIIEYEKVNHLISFYQDDKARKVGLRNLGSKDGICLELGSGPGNFTVMLKENWGESLVCLDYSSRMLTEGRKVTGSWVKVYIRGVFEALPFRSDVFQIVTSAYAIRDTKDKPRAIKEIAQILGSSGNLLIIDIGKPNNPFYRGFMSLYMKYVVPIIGGMASGQGYRNSWSLLYETFELLPVNNKLMKMIEKYLGKAIEKELAFGGLVIILGEKQIL